MAESGLIWIYLIFLLIPLSKIIPRIIKKWKEKKYVKSQQVTTEQHIISDVLPDSTNDQFRISQQRERKPESLNMLVLGEIIHGTKNYDVIRQKLGIDNKTLDSVLEDLEKKGYMMVKQKQGMLGPKVELHPTVEGAKKYTS